MSRNEIEVGRVRTRGLGLPQLLLRALEHFGSVRPGDRIGVAVSGGADSVALLLLLFELREKLGIVLIVVHFNHKLRGRSSDADEKFVAKLAERHGLEFHSASANVASKAKRERVNLEDAGRRARNDYFRSLVDSGLCARIAVAHTADDQAETVLAHLLRGTGLAGLGGIHPVRGPIFRPLLGFRRKDLRSYLRFRRQTWREDATNLDTRRTRARIRKDLLPLLEKNFQPAIVEHLASLAELARQDESFLDSIAASRLPESTPGTASEIRINANSFTVPLSFAITTRIIRRIIARLKTRPGELSALHVTSILELAHSGPPGSSLPLPGGVRVRKDRDDLVFTSLSGSQTPAKLALPANYSHTLDLSLPTQHVPLPELHCAIGFLAIDWPLKRGQTSKSGAVLDLDRLASPLVLRNWHAGDQLQPVGHRSSHKLKRFFNKKRISLRNRMVWPVLTCGAFLVWARGLGVAAEYSAGHGTRKGLLVTEEAL
jgi:tRNA(Ile)-lysidine synthase